MRWALALLLLSASALASRADRLSVSPRLDRRDRLGASAAAPDPILLSLSLLPPDSECSGTPPDGVTFTRASAATCIRSNGTAVALSTDQARVHSTLGLLVEGSATNAVLHSRDVTAAAWTGTGCAKTATGMDGVSSVGRCTGATSVSQTLTVATGARTASAYVRRQSGTCNVALSADSENTSKALTGGWERLTLTYTSDGSVAVSIGVSSGCVADIDYVQDEAGSIATSPIVTAGTAAVRAADNAETPTPGASADEGCAQVDFAPLWTGVVDETRAYLAFSGNLSGRIGYTNPGASSQHWCAYGGAGTGPTCAASVFSAGVPGSYRATWSVAANSITAWAGPTGTTTSAACVGIQVSVATLQIGGYGGAVRANAHLRNLVLGRTPEACQ